MPCLVRTPEQIFRVEKKDLYVIHSSEEADRNAPGQVMIQQWIADNLSGTAMELLAPSEYSNILCGGIGRMIRVDFTPDGLAAFSKRWEVNHRSIDPRFQCFIHSYNGWYGKHGCFVPTRDKPKGVKTTVWWHTPLGFIHHQLSRKEMSEYIKIIKHPASPDDIWYHVPTLWPEAANFDKDKLTCGVIYWFEEEKRWRAIFKPPFDLPDDPDLAPPSPEKIREWFNLPADVEVLESCP